MNGETYFVVATLIAWVEFFILFYLLVRHIRLKRAKRQPPT